MTTLSALHGRLKNASAALSGNKPLINRLKNFTVSIGQGDEARLELGAEIHTRLKEVEDEIELLRVEVDDIEAIGSSKRKVGEPSEKEVERNRVIALAETLESDLKRTRGEFRNAQLQANRNAESAKRKERDLLLSRVQEGKNLKQPSQKLTHDEVVVNASSDVTAALRRTHERMQAELSRSRFAQETLEKSTAALSSLSESYSNLDTLLSSSRTLVSSLLRSQKSDTWYLETAFYILIATIVWLVFRRMLYSPLWWLVWMPVKIVYKFTMVILGTIGIQGMTVQLSSSTALSRLPTTGVPRISSTHPPGYSVETWVSGSIFDQSPISTSRLDSETMAEKVGKMVEGPSQQIPSNEVTSIDNPPPDGNEREDEIARNPKKRMYEEDIRVYSRDEL